MQYLVVRCGFGRNSKPAALESPTVERFHRPRPRLIRASRPSPEGEGAIRLPRNAADRLHFHEILEAEHAALAAVARRLVAAERRPGAGAPRSEEHTSELQSLMRISYAVFCLSTKTLNIHRTIHQDSANT